MWGGSRSWARNTGLSHSCRNLFRAPSEGKCSKGGEAIGSQVGTGLSPGPKRGGSENLIGPKSFFSLSGDRAREASLGRVGAGPSQREAQLCPAAHRSPAPVPYSPASPAEPTQGRWSSRRLTCQALRSYPISCGRPPAAAMFSASRCQSVWRWPMGGRAGGQVIAGQLAPHWCALPSLPLRLCARSE